MKREPVSIISYQYNRLQAKVLLGVAKYTVTQADACARRGGQTHPDLDFRGYRNMPISKSNNTHTFLKCAISTGIQVFFHRFDVDYIQNNQGDWQMTNFSALFTMLYEKISARKALYSQHWLFIK